MMYNVKALGEQGVEHFSIEANDDQDLHQQVVGRGLQLIAHARQVGFRLGNKRHFPLTIFSQELVALLEAGLAIVEAIDTLAEKENRSFVGEVLEKIQSRLYEGQPLSAALAEQPSVFPTLYVATIRASERTGAIQEALQRFVDYQQQIDTLKKRLVSASIYPAVLCGAGFLVTLFLLFFVVPRFAGVYQDMGDSLPASSKLLMQWGQLVEQQGVYLLEAMLAFFALVGFVITRGRFKAAIMNSIVRLPKVGEQFLVYQLARRYRTVGMLLQGGMPVVTALRMSTGLLPENLAPRLEKAIVSIKEGKALTSSFDEFGITTPVANRMLRVGERSGNMGEMMERVASFYDDELERALDWITKLIEPVLMLVIGIVIGSIVLLMYLPIFELAGNIQ
jgi:general secretion pathway protein F